MVVSGPRATPPADARRRFLTLAASGIAAGMIVPGLPGRVLPSRRPKAILFDAFPIFDPRPVLERCAAVVPGRGAELNALWRARQFEYSWLRAAGRRYADFWKVTEDALLAAARSLRLELTSGERDQLMGAYLDLAVYPDAPAALRALADSGVRLALLSNLTPRMLQTAVRNAALSGVFERVLSTDAAQTYKPDPRAYRLGLDAMRLGRDDVLFAAFAGWDVAGAHWFGYRTYWVNRGALAAEELDATPDGSGTTLDDLVAYVTA
jgi:2-haloacid dehalogenase